QHREVRALLVYPDPRRRIVDRGGPPDERRRHRHHDDRHAYCQETVPQNEVPELAQMRATARNRLVPSGNLHDLSTLLVRRAAPPRRRRAGGSYLVNANVIRTVTRLTPA